jgi:hypothetical protein
MTDKRAYDLSARIESLQNSLDIEVLPLIELHFAKTNNQPLASYAGKGRELINEAQVRACLIDPILKELGWDITSTALVEAGIEGVNPGEHRRFLDYLGKGTLSDTKALILVEAKRLSVQLPTHDAGMDPRQVIVDTIIDSLKPTVGVLPLSPEWAKILITLRDYVHRLASCDYGPPKRAILSNGDWFVVLLNPVKSLLQERPEREDFIVTESLSETGKFAREFASALAFEYLSEFTPAVSCEDLRVHADLDSGPLNAVTSFEVMTGSLGGSLGTIGFIPSVVVQVPNGSWMRFKDESQSHDVIRGTEKIAEDLAEIESKSNALLDKLNAQAVLNFIDSATYEKAIIHKPEFPSNNLVRMEAKQHYVLHTGVNKTPFLDPGQYSNCPYHSFGPASSEGHAVTDSPITRQTANPPVHFISGSPYHCASKITDNLKKDCPLIAITRYVCCRACSLQERCWPKGFTSFPCVVAPDDDLDVTDMI